LPCRQGHALFEGKQHVKSAEFLRFGDRLYALKMKNGLSPMILAKPARLERHSPWLIFSFRLADEDFLQSCQAFWKIGEEFGSDFAFVAARPQDASNKNPAWSLGAQWGGGPFTGEVTAFP
jgi:hypothetical protein